MDRRQFLAAAGVTLAAPTPGFAAPAPALEGSAVRTGQTLDIRWNAKAQPIAIYVSSDPIAQPAFMHAKTLAARGGTWAAPLAVWPRPYFLLKTEDGRQTRVAERLLPLQGGRNFRDIGGYRTEDGRQVRWGKLYRSGTMVGLTDADRAYLNNLGIVVICDLRNPQERKSEPSPFLGEGSPLVVATDYDMSNAIAGFDSATDRQSAVAAFAAAYVAFIDTLTPQYADMFGRLVRNEAPLAFNCSAGKDRTGVAAALILSVLGAPRETIVADYALTQVYTPPTLYLKQLSAGVPMVGLTDDQAKMFRRMPAEVLQVMMGSDPDVMRQTLTRIDTTFGGPIALAKSRFGLTDATIAHMRNLYLI